MKSLCFTVLLPAPCVACVDRLLIVLGPGAVTSVCLVIARSNGTSLAGRRSDTCGKRGFSLLSLGVVAFGAVLAVPVVVRWTPLTPFAHGWLGRIALIVLDHVNNLLGHIFREEIIPDVSTANVGHISRMHVR